MPQSLTERIVETIRSKGHILETDTPHLGRFGNSRESSDKLTDLILHADKRASTSLVWAWKAEGEVIPKTGELEVILDWDENPLGVMKYDEVYIIPFNEVTAEYAYDESEGDRTLESWRKGHWEFFRKECEKIGREPAEDMPVVCTRFQLLYSL
jgi:uncharacterized protein YhfF